MESSRPNLRLRSLYTLLPSHRPSTAVLIRCSLQPRSRHLIIALEKCMSVAGLIDDDVYNYIGERLKLEGETENMGV